MFTQPPVMLEQRRRLCARLASYGLHGALLLVLLRGSTPLLLTPSDVAQGIRGSSGSLSIIYLAPVGPEAMQSTPEPPQPVLRAALPKRPAPPKVAPPHPQAEQTTAANAPEQTARGGSPYGRAPGSPLIGDEVVPALPEVFPDPPVARSDLPSGVEGDVIVEVTIDGQGNVVETKLLQGIGYGIEQKVLTVLRRWHFRPATRDGVTIASQHIVHFHYPS